VTEHSAVTNDTSTARSGAPRAHTSRGQRLQGPGQPDSEKSNRKCMRHADDPEATRTDYNRRSSGQAWTPKSVPLEVPATPRDGRDEANEAAPQAGRSVDMPRRRSTLTSRPARRARTLRPQARRARWRYLLHLVMGEMRPTKHSHRQGGLSICRRDAQHSPLGPRDEPGPPGRRPAGPDRGTSYTS